MPSPWIPDRLTVLRVSGVASASSDAPPDPQSAVAVRDESLLSVVIPSRGKPGLLRDTLRSLRRQTGGCAVDIVIVHHDTDPSVADALGPAGASVPVTTVQAEGPLSPARARNLGFACSRGARVVFLEPGVEVSAGWAHTLWRALDGPDTVAAQPLVQDERSRVFSAGQVCSPWSVLPFRLYADASPADPHIARERRLRMLSSVCLALRAREFARVAGFDEGYASALDDADLCLRLTLPAAHGVTPLADADTLPQGRHCVLVPGVSVVFRGSRFPGLLQPTPADRRRFVERWRGDFVADALAHFAVDGQRPVRWTVDDTARLESSTQVHVPTLEPAGDGAASPAPDPFRRAAPDEACPRKDCFDVWMDGDIPHREGKPVVLLVAHYAPVEMFGGERSFLDVLHALDALQCNVVVIVPRSPPPAYLRHILARSARVYVFRYDWWNGRSAASRAAVNRFSRVCEITGARVVYLNTLMSEAAALGARDAGVPVITHVRELITGDPWLAERIGLPVEAIVSAVSARSDCIVANSRATAAMFSDHPRVVVAPNVVDDERFDMANAVDPARIVFGLISSNQPKKGLRDFFVLASQCERLGLPAAFLLIGPDNAHVRDAAAAVCPDGPPSNVEICGYLEDPRDAIARVNVVLSLSWFTESFGRTIAEGFAARRPAIGYNRGAVPELIEEGVSGFLVAPEDIDGLVRAVRHLCEHPADVVACGERGRQKVLESCRPDRLRAGLARALAEVSALR